MMSVSFTKGRFMSKAAVLILLTVLWIYLPMLLRAPTDVVALNYFFDTLLFCGTILLVANAMEDSAQTRKAAI